MVELEALLMIIGAILCDDSQNSLAWALRCLRAPLLILCGRVIVAGRAEGARLDRSRGLLNNTPQRGILVLSCALQAKEGAPAPKPNRLIAQRARRDQVLIGHLEGSR